MFFENHETSDRLLSLGALDNIKNQNGEIAWEMGRNN